MTVIFLIYHFWLSIAIHIPVILDFQNNLYFQETWQTNATIKAVFPVKSKLHKPFWLRSYGINLEKVNSFILEQLRIIEFYNFDH